GRWRSMRSASGSSQAGRSGTATLLIARAALNGPLRGLIDMARSLGVWWDAGTRPPAPAWANHQRATLHRPAHTQPAAAAQQRRVLLSRGWPLLSAPAPKLRARAQCVSIG